MSDGNPEKHQCNSGEEETGEQQTNSNGNASAANDEFPDGDSPKSSLAKGLSSMLSSVIRDFDSQAQDTVRSQDQLSFAIDRLTRELDQLLEDVPSPFIMQHAAKISGVRKRVSSLNSVLKSIQWRVDNIDRMLSAGLPSDKMASGSDVQR